MKSAIAIVFEGVLSKPVASIPIPEGLLLYQGLCEVSSVLLVSGETPKDELDSWLIHGNLTRHAHVLYPDNVIRKVQGSQYRVWQANQLRAMGYAVDLIIEPDPANVAALLREGYNCLHFLHAQYSVPDWRPDYTGAIKSWEELSGMVANQARLRNEDNRLRWDE